MFYGASDEETAIKEVCNNVPYVTVAPWETLREFKILDLTNLPPLPSLFDERQHYLRHSIFFLDAFANDVSKSIDKDGREHIEYIPTQIVTEYFRHIFLDKENEHIKGIIYRSSRRRNGKSCVLFFTNDDCTQDNIDDENSTEKWLMLLTKSVKNVEVL